jgi:hypothetical protein
MEDILLSDKQWAALLKKIDKINGDVSALKVKSDPETRYLDNMDMMNLLQVSNRTLQRWRKDGRLSSNKVGGNHFYKANDLLEHFALNPKNRGEPGPLPCECPGFDPEEFRAECHLCPIFMLLIT